jgi:exportin-T
LNSAEKSFMQATLWNWLLEHVQQKFPYFLRNKLFVLIVLLFKNRYPRDWPSFFDELFNVLETQPSSIKTFLHICMTIDEEVVCQYIQRGDEELQKNTLIKDTMREVAIPRLVSTWHKVLQNFYRSEASITNLCLNVFGVYVSWIEIGLIMKDGFLNCLYDCFSIDTVKNAAADCLSNMILKGMKPVDKLNFIELLNVIPMLQNLTILNDPVFEEQIAKLVNTIGLEICGCCEDHQSSEQDKVRSLKFLDSLFPLLLKFLSNEYDDTTSALFSFLSAYLLMIKRVRRMGIPGISNDNLRSLLQVLASKMKYDLNEEYRVGDAAGEDEALFAEMRKGLKIHLESIAAIDDELFSATICDVVCSLFDRIKTSSKTVSWVDAELSLYLLYGYSEAKVQTGPPSYILESGQLTSLGVMLTKMMDSGISQYLHPSIPAIYFEVVIRYAKFFEQRQDLIPAALQSFLDTRGLFHSSKPLRLRINYLFLRFIKLLRSTLGQYVESILAVIQPLLVIKQRAVEKIDLSKSTDFDSQVYLFEAVGYLISTEAISDQRRGELLTVTIFLYRLF